MSICESSHSDQSSDTSGISVCRVLYVTFFQQVCYVKFLVVGGNANHSGKMSISPELRRLDQLTKSETSRAAGHLSCPDLENMVAKANIPNRAIEVLDRKEGKSAPTHLLQTSFSTPDSSQTESEEASPLLQRRRRQQNREPVLPKFSFYSEDLGKPGPEVCLKVKQEADHLGPKSLPVTPKVSVQPNTPSPLVTSSKTLRTNQNISPSSIKSLPKSSSATGLSLMIPTDEATFQSIQSPGGSSTASSRDVSPCRDLSPLINTLNPPIIVRRGPKGFGFTIRAIRVYFGDSDFYTVQHLVMEVDRGSPAFDAGKWKK